ncbi:hypothetical protein MKX03_036379, partial [Papaver bracteatum]
VLSAISQLKLSSEVWESVLTNPYNYRGIWIMKPLEQRPVLYLKLHQNVSIFQKQ